VIPDLFRVAQIDSAKMCFVKSQLTRVTDRQSDRQTDRQTDVMAISIAERLYRDLEIQVCFHSISLEIAAFDRSHTSSYSSSM